MKELVGNEKERFLNLKEKRENKKKKRGRRRLFK